MVADAEERSTPARDERYHFQGFPEDFLIGLGRLTLGASYLEGTLATMLWRLLDNEDLELGKRVTADAGFRWLCDHVRAVSEHRLPPDLHQQLSEWVARAEKAHTARNRLVHSEVAVNWNSDKKTIGHLWVRTTAKGKSFAETISPAEAAEVHEVAVELERVGLEGVHLMSPVQDAVGRPGSSSN